MRRLAATAPNEAAPLLFAAIETLERSNNPTLAYVSAVLLKEIIITHQLRPKDISMADLWYRVGVAAWNSNHHVDAQQAFREALNHDPEHLRTQQQLYVLASEHSD